MKSDDLLMNRRQLLQRAGGGFGMIALASLLDRSVTGAAIGSALNPMAPRAGHLPAHAKSVIWVFTNGGPSQVDTWDYKPALAKHDGQELNGPDHKTGFFANEVGPLMKSPFAWKQHGQSGTGVPETVPHVARHVHHSALR